MNFLLGPGLFSGAKWLLVSGRVRYHVVGAAAASGTDGKQPLTGDVLSFVMEPSASKPGQMAPW